MPLNLKAIFSSGAEKLVNAVGDAFDKNFTNKEEREAAKLEVQKEVNRHIEALASEAAEIEKAYLQDVANARALQIAALNQTDLFSKRFMYYLAAFIILSATAFGVMLFYIVVPEENKRLVEMFSDVYLFAGALSVIYFFFGSSKGSHDKNETGAIKDAVNNSK